MSYSVQVVLTHPALLSGDVSTTEGEKPNKIAGLDDGSSAREDKKDQRRKKAASM